MASIVYREIGNKMPCNSTENPKDIPYMEKVFEFIENSENAGKFDTSKVYIQGFSQNSVFAAYIGNSRFSLECFQFLFMHFTQNYK